MFDYDYSHIFNVPWHLKDKTKKMQLFLFDFYHLLAHCYIISSIPI